MKIIAFLPVKIYCFFVQSIAKIMVLSAFYDRFYIKPVFLLFWLSCSTKSLPKKRDRFLSTNYGGIESKAYRRRGINIFDEKQSHQKKRTGVPSVFRLFSTKHAKKFCINFID